MNMNLPMLNRFVYNFLGLFFSIILFISSVSAQCGGSTPSNPPANPDCASATPITTNDLYSGSTADFPAVGSGHWLNGVVSGVTIENIGYYQFTASSSTIKFQACTPCNSFVSGIQMYLFKTCGDKNSKIFVAKQICGSCGSLTISGGNGVSGTYVNNGSGCYTFTLTGLTIGETYYWGVDGYEGANCGYTIQFSEGIETSTTVTPGVSVSNSTSSICVGESATFTATPTNGGANPTYQWQVNGTNVSGQTNSTFTSTTLASGDVVTVIMTSSDPCASPTTANGTAPSIQVNTPTAPTFAQIGPFCLGTTAPSLPSSSQENIAGTWSPSAINTSAVGTTTYTFTPSSGGCYVSTAVEISITTEIEPSFTNPGPICSGISYTLPSTSSNGILGSWSPAVNSTETTTYTFTPAATEECASTTTMTVVVTDEVTPTFTNPGPICQGMNFTLPTTSNNGISGTWSPAMNNQQTTTYTFTAISSQSCAGSAQMTVEVNPGLTVSVEKINADCSGNLGEASVAVNGGTLPYSYTWSNGSDSTKAVELLEGNYSVNVTDAKGCSGTSNFSVQTDDHFDAVTISIPNIITPNNDGVNDEFEIPFVDNPCVDIQMHIMNRWGVTVLELDKDNPVFSGVDAKGKQLTEGIYFYQIVSKALECKKDENKGKCSGFIHIVT